MTTGVALDLDHAGELFVNVRWKDATGADRQDTILLVAASDGLQIRAANRIIARLPLEDLTRRLGRLKVAATALNQAILDLEPEDDTDEHYE